MDSPIIEKLNIYLVMTPIIVGVVIFILSHYGIVPIPELLGFLSLIGGFTVGIGVVIINFISKASVLRDLEPKLPYIYLFMEMYLLSGYSPEEAIIRTARHVDVPTLEYIYRYASTGMQYSDIFKVLFGKGAHPARVHIENLIKTGVFGMGGLLFIRDTFERLLEDMTRTVEKINTQIMAFIEVYSVFGLLLPMTLLLSVALLAFFGEFGLFTVTSVSLLTIILTIFSSLLLILVTRELVRKVKL